LVPTGLLIGILIATTPLFALGVYDLSFPRLGLSVMLVALLLAVLDNLLSRRSPGVEVTRTLPRVLSLGADNPIRVHVQSRAPRPLRLRVKDDPPNEFITASREWSVRLEPYEGRQLRYHTKPLRRGDVSFGDLHVRGLSRLRLSWWQRTIQAREDSKVYPNLLEVHKYQALARRGRLEDMGLRTVRMRGEGTEFESLREYLPDDSFRHIDWKATAKRGTPITRQFQTERSQTLMLVVDSGRMMSAHSGDMTKLDLAVNAALMLAHVAATSGDSVGLLSFADRVKTFVPPRKGQEQTRRLVEELYNLEADLVEPDYRGAFGYLRNRARKRALVAVFTDLVDSEVSGQLLAYAGTLAPQHLPLMVTIRDEQVEAISRQMPADGVSAYERALASRMLHERALALARLRQRGALICDARPDEIVARTVSHYLSIKRQGLL
jgi:uncharacterized protein (DUF58 family)